MSTTGHESDIITVSGLKTSLQKLKTDHINGKVNDVSFDSSTGKIKKTINGTTTDVVQVYQRSETYTKTEVNNLVSTPRQNYVTVSATSSTPNVTSLLPATGSADTVYRVANWNGSQYNTAYYTEYAWNGSAYVQLDVKNTGIEDTPTPKSTKMVTSDGVFSGDEKYYSSYNLINNGNKYVSNANKAATSYKTATVGQTYDLNPTAATYFAYYKIKVKQNAKYKLYVNYAYQAYTWVFLDSNLVVLSKSTDRTSMSGVLLEPEIITAPSNAEWLIVHVYNSDDANKSLYPCYCYEYGGVSEFVENIGETMGQYIDDKSNFVEAYNNKTINTDGSLAGKNGFKILTKKVNVGDTYRLINLSGKYGSFFIAYCVYGDENLTTPVLIGEQMGGYLDKEVTIPSGGVLLAVSYKTTENVCEIYTKGTYNSILRQIGEKDDKPYIDEYKDYVANNLIRIYGENEVLLSCPDRASVEANCTQTNTVYEISGTTWSKTPMFTKDMVAYPEVKYYADTIGYADNTTIFLFLDKNNNILGGLLWKDRANGMIAPPNTAKIRINVFVQGNGFTKLTVTCMQKTKALLPNGLGSSAVRVNVSTKHIQADNLYTAVEKYNRKEAYISTEEMNLANACMMCNLGTWRLGISHIPYIDNYVLITEEYPNVVRDRNECGKKVEGLAGYGREIHASNIKFHFDKTEAFSVGFWVRVSDYVSNPLTVTTTSGANGTISHDGLLKEGTRLTANQLNNILDVYVSVANYNGYSYIQILQKETLASTNERTLGISNPNYSTNGSFYIHNFTAVISESRSELNPFAYYENITDRVHSNCVGKVLIMTGDSNGGGGIGKTGRYKIAATRLGMPVIEASNGGWAMQGRMLDTEANKYGWLFYHKFRNSVVNANGDIYLFNQCTNDGHVGNDATFSNNKYHTTHPEKYGTDAEAYGKFGDGSLEDIKHVLDIYTSQFASLLEAGNLNALYKGESLYTWCRRDMTTLGCTGAFIYQVLQNNPDAVCIIDSTISSIGTCNSLLGAFNSGGISSGSRYESDDMGLVYSPYLLSSVDSNGHPTSYIDNGTINGGTPVTTITSSSSLTDGNNYRLYHYYAYKDYNKVVGTDQITDEEDAAICAKCHQYYEDAMGTTYGRLSPFDLNYANNMMNAATSARAKDYREGVENMRSILRIPFIDAGYNSCVNIFNITRYAADAGHWKQNAHDKLGTYICNAINMLF